LEATRRLPYPKRAKQVIVQTLGHDYVAGAGERLRAAQIMYERARYVDAIYSAGVATECILRAFLQEKTKEFDARHDLRELLKSAALLERFVGEKQRAVVSASLGEVWSRWRNNYRYIGEDRLRAEFKSRGLDRGIKGDFLKENARVTFENATTLVNKGTYQWNQK
jgi:HEPN domain-containing protein